MTDGVCHLLEIEDERADLILHHDVDCVLEAERVVQIDLARVALAFGKVLERAGWTSYLTRLRK